MQVRPKTAGKVFCEVCMTHLAKPDALSIEHAGAVVYFCGAACYERWHALHPAPTRSAARPPKAGSN